MADEELRVNVHSVFAVELMVDLEVETLSIPTLNLRKGTTRFIERTESTQKVPRYVSRHALK